MSILFQNIVNLLLYGCDCLWRHKVIVVQKMIAILETYHLWRNK